MSGHIEYHPHAGAEIRNTCATALRIADLLQVNVEFRFNDVLCMASPGGSADTLAENQQAEQARKLTGPYDRRFASSRTRSTSGASV